MKCLNIVLPVAAKLSSLNINVDPMCTLYGREAKTMEHLFFKCDWVKRVWFASSLGLRMEEITFQNTKWFEVFIEIYKIDQESLFSIHDFYLLYHIWFRRNKARFEMGALIVSDIIHATLLDRQVWKDANSNVVLPTTSLINTEAMSWLLLPQGG